MGNIQYEASSVIAGVSTRPYALRTEGHALDQENCFLSTKYGLCKRPGTTLLQMIESSTPSYACMTFPLYRDEEERVVVGLSAIYGKLSSYKPSFQVFTRDGKKEPVTLFPSSTDASIPAANAYAKAGAIFGPEATTTTLGDVTWICDPNVVPKMRDAVWEVYKEVVNTQTITNDQVFTIWVKNIIVTTAEDNNLAHTVNVVFTNNDTGVQTNSM